jgi:hypothetical protein
MKKYKKKCATGTGMNYITTPDMAVAKSNLLNDQASAEASTNPLIPIVSMIGGLVSQYGSSMGNAPVKAAYGKMPMEIEGEEVIQEPGKPAMKVEGNSHDEGGIDINADQNTKVYADRVKGPDGKTMAQRKLARERKKAELEDLINSDKTDEIKKNTYKRTYQNLVAQEEKDLQTQELAGMMASLLKLPHSDNEEEVVAAYGSNAKKYALGTDPRKKYIGNNLMNKTEVEDLSFDLPNLNLEPSVPEALASPEQPSANAWRMDKSNPSLLGIEESSTGNTQSSSMPDIPLNITGNETTFGKKTGHFVPENSDSSSRYMPTAGDITKLTGNLMGMLGQNKITAENRAGDTIHRNMYEDVGKEAISTLEDTKGAFDENLATQMTTARQQTSANKRGARKGLRGMNEMRAMEAMYDMGLIMNYMQASANNVAQKAGIDSQIAQTQMGASQAKAQGALIARDNNDKDRDNYYTNKAKDYANLTKLVQQTGKDLNSLNLNQTQLDLLSQLSENFTVTQRNGKYEFKAKD